MKQLNITDKTLADLFAVNQYQVPADGAKLVFVGIRAALPLNTADNTFKEAQVLKIGSIDYKNLNCTILQWDRRTGLLAAFAGSTVPNINNILAFKENPLRNSNCLCPGFYKNYRRGQHRPAKPANWYDAFRQDGQPLIIRRTYEQTGYGNFGITELSIGCDDNIHAAWTMETNNNYFSSAGCQVIMGIPYCESTKGIQTDNRGPWKIFKDNGYRVDQPIYPYALFNSSEVDMLQSKAGGETASVRLKFGSGGDVVKEMQISLINKKYLSGSADGDFGKDTFNAVIKFQLDNFGSDGVDGVVGPLTAQALGIVLPSVRVGNPIQYGE